MNSGNASHPTTQHIGSTFLSAGVICAATLHLPESYNLSDELTKDAKKLPAVLMIHGWGGIQDALLAPFQRAFNAAGFAVMSFDYPTWGKSQGLPRNHIDPWQRERDVDAALSHLKSQAQVDARKIVLWGSSFGGGHTVAIAAQHPSLLGAIAHVPMLDGRAASLANPFKRRLPLLAVALADQLVPRKPIYIPIIAPEGQFSSMDRDGAYQALVNGLKQENILRESYYDNRVQARSILKIAFYRPYKFLKDIKIPLLLVGGKHDTVAPFVEKKIRAINNPFVQINMLDANHFEPYFEPILTPNIAQQVQFLKGLL